jgi:hypothetical protein
VILVATATYLGPVAASIPYGYAVSVETINTIADVQKDLNSPSTPTHKDANMPNTNTPAICPICQSPLLSLNPTLYCATCRWPVYRLGTQGQWVEQVPPQCEETEIRFQAGLTRIYQAMLRTHTLTEVTS